MSKILHGTYFYFKRLCLPKIQIYLNILYFYLLNLAFINQDFEYSQVKKELWVLQNCRFCPAKLCELVTTDLTVEI